MAENFPSSPEKGGRNKPARDFEPTGFLGQGMSGSLTKGSVSAVLAKLGMKRGEHTSGPGFGSYPMSGYDSQKT